MGTCACFQQNIALSNGDASQKTYGHKPHHQPNAISIQSDTQTTNTGKTIVSPSSKTNTGISFDPITPQQQKQHHHAHGTLVVHSSYTNSSTPLTITPSNTNPLSSMSPTPPFNAPNKSSTPNNIASLSCDEEDIFDVVQYPKKLHAQRHDSTDNDNDQQQQQQSQQSTQQSPPSQSQPPITATILLRSRSETFSQKMNDLIPNRLKRSNTFHEKSQLKSNSSGDSKRKLTKTSTITNLFRSKSKKTLANVKFVYEPNTPIRALEIAVMAGDTKAIIVALQTYEVNYPNFFMDYANEQGRTLLMRAASLSHFGLMKYLILRYKKYKDAIFDSVEPAYGRDVASMIIGYMGDYINYESKAGKSALIFACQSNHKCRINNVRYLLESGASVVNPNNSEHGKSPLIYAVEWKSYELIELLLNYGADINIKDKNNGCTPLMFAAKYNDKALCEFLLSHNADIGLMNKHGKTAVDIAKEDRCWASLLALNVKEIPSNILPLAVVSPPKNRWGRYSASYSNF